MKDLYGTYLGFTFTDESDAGVGEMRVVIDDKHFTLTIATGLDIDEDIVDISEMREMTAEEIVADFNDGFDVTGIRGIVHATATPGTIMGFLRLIFVPPHKGTGEEIEPGMIDKDTDECVLVRGMFGEEYFGASMLFTPAQVEAGEFEKALKGVEEAENAPGIIPRIDSDGRAPRDNISEAPSS